MPSTPADKKIRVFLADDHALVRHRPSRPTDGNTGPPSHRGTGALCSEKGHCPAAVDSAPATFHLTLHAAALHAAIMLE